MTQTLKNRLMFGTLIVSIIVLLLWLDIRANGIIVLSIISLLTAAGVYEFYKMCAGAGARPFTGAGIIVSALFAPYFLGVYAPMVPYYYVYSPADSAIWAVIPALILLFGSFLLASKRHEGLQEQTVNISITMLGFLYVAVPMLFLLLIRNLAYGWELLIIVVAISKGTDIGAYFTGSLIGKHKLAPKISPNKTIEGAVGGLVLATILAVVLVKLLSVNLLIGRNMLATIGFSILVAAAAQFGDLTESLIKRSTGAKDSAKMLPAFGGVLDMIDSFLVSAPVAWFALVILDVIESHA